MERVEQRLALLLAHRQAPVGRLAVDTGLDRVKLLEAPQRLFGDRRLRGLEHLEELAPGMRYAGDMGDARRQIPLGPIERGVTGECISVQVAAEAGEMAARPLTPG